MIAIGPAALLHSGSASKGHMSMSKTTAFVLTAGVAFVVACSLGLHGQQSQGDGPRYVNGTNLARPTDYREWIFLSSGLDMNYNPPPGTSAGSSQPPERHSFT